MCAVSSLFCIYYTYIFYFIKIQTKRLQRSFLKVSTVHCSFPFQNPLI